MEKSLEKLLENPLKIDGMVFIEKTRNRWKTIGKSRENHSNIIGTSTKIMANRPQGDPERN